MPPIAGRQPTSAADAQHGAQALRDRSSRAATPVAEPPLRFVPASTALSPMHVPSCRRSKRKFNDENVCKYYLCGFCPYEVRLRSPCLGLQG